MKITLAIIVGIVIGACWPSGQRPDVYVDQVEDHFFVVSSAPGHFAVTHYPGCWCREKHIDLAAEKAAQLRYAAESKQ